VQVSVDSEEAMMPAGAHICALCTEPAERNELSLAFRQEGQSRGEACLRLTDDPEHGLGLLPETGQSSTAGCPRPDVRPASEVFLRHGRFSAERMTAVLVERAAHEAEAGSPQLRVVVEMGWLHEQVGTSDVLQHYETAVDHLVRQVSAVVLCVHDLRRLDAEMLTTVLAVHQTVLLEDTVLVNQHHLIEGTRPSAATGPGRQTQQTTAGDPWETLTQSELRVAAHVAVGLTNREMAALLLVSRHTIDAHLKHIFIKLGIHTRVELTVLTLRHRSP
jgi:DNA-binding CsgD family transcriptional regulator